MNQDGDLVVVGAEGLEFEEALRDFDEEIVIVVHLLDDFDNVGDELITDSIMTEDRGDDRDFSCGIKFEVGVIAFKLFNVNCAIFFLAIVEAHWIYFEIQISIKLQSI